MLQAPQSLRCQGGLALGKNKGRNIEISAYILKIGTKAVRPDLTEKLATKEIRTNYNQQYKGGSIPYVPNWPVPFPGTARDFWAAQGSEACQHTFLTVVDNVLAELELRIAAYRVIPDRFGIFRQLAHASNDKASEATVNRINA